MFAALCDYGVTGRALKKGLWHFTSINPRDFTENQLGYIDDRPFGGGPGMVMQAGPLLAAYREAQKKNSGINKRYLSKPSRSSAYPKKNTRVSPSFVFNVGVRPL